MIDPKTLAKAFNNAFMDPGYMSEADAILVIEEYELLMEHPEPLCKCGHTRPQHESRYDAPDHCTHRCAPPWNTGKQRRLAAPRREPVKPR